jgi:RimJ/RimL family protein N-acetyltransferase
MGDGMPQDQASYVEHQMRRTGWRTFGVWRDAELGGVVMFEPACDGVWSIHIILKPAFFGSGARAAGLGIERMFALGARKIISVILASNRLFVKGMGLRLGFVPEGCLRQHVMAQAKPADVLLFGLLKGDWHGADIGVVRRRKRALGTGERDALDQRHHNDQLGNADGNHHGDGIEVVHVRPQPDGAAGKPVPDAGIKPKRRRRRRD